MFQLLQPPDSKVVKSRGSWPGPGTGRLLGTVTAELSRSEQQLSNSGGKSSPPPLPPPRPESHSASQTGNKTFLNVMYIVNRLGKIIMCSICEGFN